MIWLLILLSKALAACFVITFTCYVTYFYRKCNNEKRPPSPLDVIVEAFYAYKFAVFRLQYVYVMKVVLFQCDPEVVHDLFISIGEAITSCWVLRTFTSFLFRYENERYLHQSLRLRATSPPNREVPWSEAIGRCPDCIETLRRARATDPTSSSSSKDDVATETEPTVEQSPPSVRSPSPSAPSSAPSSMPSTAGEQSSDGSSSSTGRRCAVGALFGLPKTVPFHISNPVGLAAGFDKNCRLYRLLPEVGFGFAECGSVTGERCEGNPKPRLWRIPEQESIQVYYGLKNEGCEAIASRLRHGRLCDSGACGSECSSERQPFAANFPVGISVARTNSVTCATVDAGIADYVKALDTMWEVADFITINVSCPNVFGGHSFVVPDKLKLLLVAMFGRHSIGDEIDADRTCQPQREDDVACVDRLNPENTQKLRRPETLQHVSPGNDNTSSRARVCDRIAKPVFVKISPDLSTEEIDGVVDVVASVPSVSGIICTNLTKRHTHTTASSPSVPSHPLDQMPGGRSGRPLRDRSTEIVRRVYQRLTLLHKSGGVVDAPELASPTGGVIVIGVGGVFNSQDAYEKIRAGASAVQLISGMIFEGPSSVGEINSGLRHLLSVDGHRNVSGAVGIDHTEFIGSGTLEVL
eukprot:TRINITY_DN7612_c0_g1_i1.p1 TRINITY_DN7612_c0_g1~~TRINITY_DN7612_c0_g1_i1.p1  ORF type:complete len:639 (+),score=86.53 TRINITY_DN7612_c0_g1_i1:257-2173(+)